MVGVRISGINRLVLALALGAAISPAQTNGSMDNMAATPPPPGSLPGSSSSVSGSVSPNPGANGSHSVALSGNVILDDGSPPAANVAIERVCDGIPRVIGRTDVKGNFNVQLNQDQGSQDASYSSGALLGNLTREITRFDCEIRASLTGFRSDVVSLSNHQYMDSPEVGTIILHRLGSGEGLTVSATSTVAPKDARKAFESGLAAANKGKTDEAQKNFKRAVEIYPKYAQAWLELGKADEAKSQVEEARRAYAQALAADPSYIYPYERLYLLALHQADWQGLAENTDRVLRLNPYDFPGAYYYNAVAYLQLKKNDLAEKSALQALALDPQHHNPRIHYILGLILANRRDFADAAQNLKVFLAASPNASDAPTIRKQLAEIERSARAQAQPANPASR